MREGQGTESHFRIALVNRLNALGQTGIERVT